MNKDEKNFQELQEKYNLQRPLIYYSNESTVCILIPRRVWSVKEKREEIPVILARGVAVCSSKDRYIKRIGRAIARGRAIQALWNKNSSLIFRERIIEKDVYKSHYLPRISKTEKQILNIE